MLTARMKLEMAVRCPVCHQRGRVAEYGDELHGDRSRARNIACMQELRQLADWLEAGDDGGAGLS